MKTRWQELRTKYWINRPAHERRMITIAVIILLPIVYYYLLWQPAHQTVKKLQFTLPSLQAQLLKMKDQAAEVDMLRHRPVISALDATSLKSSVTDSASRHQLSGSITSLEAQEPNAVHLTCDAISFSAWINWLHELEQEQHIRADAISISPLAQAGMVKISATLTNGSLQ